MDPNLAGFLAASLAAGPALWAWRRRKRAKPETPIPFVAVGASLLAGVIAATVAAVADMRPATTKDTTTITIPDVPLATLRKDARETASGPHRLTALLVREADSRVVGKWETKPGESDLWIRTPLEKKGVAISLSQKNWQLALTEWSDQNRGFATEHESLEKPGPGGLYVLEPTFDDSVFRKRNLFSLLTRGADYRLMVFAVPEGRYPMETVNAHDWLASLGWLLPPSKATTFDAYEAERDARRNGPEFWKAEPVSQDGLWSRLYDLKKNGRYRAEMISFAGLWGDAFGPAAVVAFLAIPALLCLKFKYRRIAGIAIFFAMLISAVALERFVASACCDICAYHRLFTLNPPPAGTDAR